MSDEPLVFHTNPELIHIIEDAFELLGHDEDRYRHSKDLNHIFPMEISTEHPLTKCFDELKSKDDQEYHTEFVNLAEGHAVIAVRCMKIVIDQVHHRKFAYAKCYWIKHLARTLPSQNLLILVDSYIRSGQLENDEPEEVYKVLLKWLEQLDSSPMSIEAARSKILITALCNIIYPGCIKSGILGQCWMWVWIRAKIHCLTAKMLVVVQACINTLAA
ncbi:hypothetical protein F5880DRAFT_1175648 [Lentinula raphanica]|nr:hypothetical protein F5880DRAFT_1175648 [Lentinula raphanica]